MRTRRVIGFGLLLTMLMLLCTSTLYALSTHVFSFHNIFSTEGVSIKLKQYQLNGDGKRVIAQSKSVLPGERVSYIPVIENRGTDCYVRIRIRIKMEDRAIRRSIRLDDLYGIGPDWKQIGEYYYYTKVIKHGESIDACHGVTIPYSWTQHRHESSGFELYVKADAIQSADYNPNFKSDNPWNGVVMTGDDSVYRYWTALLMCMLIVALYGSKIRRG